MHTPPVPQQRSQWRLAESEPPPIIVPAPPATATRPVPRSVSAPAQSSIAKKVGIWARRYPINAAAFVILLVCMGWLAITRAPLPFGSITKVALGYGEVNPANPDPNAKRIVHFSPKNPPEMLEWVSVIHGTLNDKARQGNKIAYDEYRTQVTETLRSHIGQEVVWGVEIESVNPRQVKVKNYFPPAFCFTCMPDAGSAPNRPLTPEEVLVEGGIIHVGHQVSLDEVRDLRRGSALRIRGVISRAELLQQSHMVAIELRGVTSAAFSPEQRAAALAAKAPQLSGEEKIDQWFQGMNHLLAP